MNVNNIIALIRKRRDELRTAVSAGSASDPTVVVAAGMVSEYDSLLVRIEASIQAEATIDNRK
jgi:hypothetical protein